MIENLGKASMKGVKFGILYGAAKILDKNEIKGIFAFTSLWFIDWCFVCLGDVNKMFFGTNRVVLNITNAIEEIQRYLPFEFNQALMKELGKNCSQTCAKELFNYTIYNISNQVPGCSRV
jgi:hypothetical protein